MKTKKYLIEKNNKYEAHIHVIRLNEHFDNRYKIEIEALFKDGDFLQDCKYISGNDDPTKVIDDFISEFTKKCDDKIMLGDYEKILEKKAI